MTGTAKLAELPRHELLLPRNAFSPRETARAGDVWRAFQDVAVRESIRVGWSPARYRETSTSFLVRQMTVRHLRETSYGDPLVARTWVSRFRREMFSTREVRMDGEHGPVAHGTQEWVHVAADLTPTRAGDALTAAFPVVHVEDEASVALPEVADPREGTKLHVLTFRCWNVWMDPLAHVNHPAYVDFCDEAVAAVAVRAGLLPQAIVPVAESALFRSGVVADDEVRIESHLAGVTADGAAVVKHRVLVGERRCADVTTVRTLASGDGAALVGALG